MLGLCVPARAHLARLIFGVVLATPAAFAQEKSANLTLIREPVKEVTARDGGGMLLDRGLPGPMPLGGKANSPARARREPNDRPWWIGGELGEGQLELTSDQSSGSRVSTFELGFMGGHTLGSRARVGLEFNGWLLQAFNFNNPAVGESVSDVLGVFDLLPSRKTPFFLRAGTGIGLYQNNRPNGFNGHGWGWTVGAGYEIPLTERFGLAPMVGYAAGGRGDVRNSITVETGRRYSAIEFKAAILWHFGTPKKST